MTRLILLGIVVVVFIMVVRFLFPSPSSKSEEAETTEMVQDPNCDTYIPRTQAIRRTVCQREHYFCSEKCAEEFAHKNG